MRIAAALHQIQFNGTLQRLSLEFSLHLFDIEAIPQVVEYIFVWRTFALFSRFDYFVHVMVGQNCAVTIEMCIYILRSESNWVWGSLARSCVLCPNECNRFIHILRQFPVAPGAAAAAAVDAAVDAIILMMFLLVRFSRGSTQFTQKLMENVRGGAWALFPECEMWFSERYSSDVSAMKIDRARGETRVHQTNHKLLYSSSLLLSMHREPLYGEFEVPADNTITLGR